MNTAHAGEIIAVAVDLKKNPRTGKREFRTLLWVKNSRESNWNNSDTANPTTGVDGITFVVNS